MVGKGGGGEHIREGMCGREVWGDIVGRCGCRELGVEAGFVGGRGLGKHGGEAGFVGGGGAWGEHGPPPYPSGFVGGGHGRSMVGRGGGKGDG